MSVSQAAGDLERALAGAIENAALALAVGAATATVAAVVAELLQRHRRTPRLVLLLSRMAPPPLRRAVAVLVTVTTATLAGPGAARADTAVRDWLAGLTIEPPAGSPPTTTSTPAPIATEDDLARRDARAGAPAVSEPGPSTPPDDGTHVHVVRPGDCLWSIAAAALGPQATNRAIDAGWRAIYTQNRRLIGDDPNLIYPGVALTLPPLPTAS